MYQRLKHRTWQILDTAHPADRAGRMFTYFLVSLIALNIVALVAESVPEIYRAAPRLFPVVEAVSIVVFSIEYLLRLWSSTASPDYRHPIGGRLRFARTPLAAIDLLAVLPFYLPFVGFDLRVFRSVRLVRVFRIAKLARYSEALRMFGRVIARKREELLTVLLVAFVLLLIASTLMYYIEGDVHPKGFGSIPETMWWGIATLTTVGYGDVYPVTPPGKVLGAIIAVLGIGLFALPTGILGAAFVEDLSHRRHHPHPHPHSADAASPPAACPHCGQPLSTATTAEGRATAGPTETASGLRE